MKKKLLATILTMSCLLGSASALAEENDGYFHPNVFVNGSEIVYSDQSAILLPEEERTLVPVRGVFEALGYSVDWNQEKLAATMTTADNKDRVRVYIGSKEMEKIHFESVLSATTDKVAIDAAPCVINDRTMVPLRAIAEALNADVSWDDTTKSVIIKTNQGQDISKNPSLAIYTDADDVNAGDEFTVYTDVSNLNLTPDEYISGVTATLEYDHQLFEMVSAEFVNGDNTVAAAMGVTNPDHVLGGKIVYTSIDSAASAKQAGKILKITMKALTNEGGTITLSNSYSAGEGYNGYNTALMFSDTKTLKDTRLSGSEELNVVTAPIVLK